MPRLDRLAVCFGSLLLLSNSIRAGSPEYRFQVLPVPDGCEAYSQWHGLSRDGVAVGILFCNGAPALKAVAWQDSTVRDLPALGGPSALPFGVDRNGIAVGLAETPDLYDTENHVQRPVVWDGDSVRDLGTLGGPLGGATSVNAAGVIVGASQVATVDPVLGRRPMRATVWERGSLLDIGDLGGPEAFAYDVSDRGWIVGSSATRVPLGSGAGFEEHAFLYDGRFMQDLGTLGGRTSFAWALNARGEVVGYSWLSERPTPGALSWHAFVWRRGTMLDLGTLGGAFSEAMDINSQGEIVGWSRLSTFVDHAVRWRGDRMIDLNDVVADTGGCVLTRATGITDAGDILVDVRCDGRSRVAILTRSDDPE